MSAAPAPPEVNEVADAASFRQATGASDAQMADIERFQTLIEDWNTRLNLVGPSAQAAFWPRHAWDSAQLLPLGGGAKVWADLGAGAGFPGVILAILLKQTEGAKVHLIESMAKRCRFLEAVAGELELPVVIHNERAENLRLGVDIVTARACAPLPRLLGYARPYLNAGATGLFLKGREIESEMAEAQRKWKFAASLVPSLSDPSGRIVIVEGGVRER